MGEENTNTHEERISINDEIIDSSTIVIADEQNDNDDASNNGTITIGETDYTLNNDGDAVDKEGVVFKTKDEIAELDTNEDDKEDDDENAIEIEGEKFILDKDGNAVDKEGVIKHTKEQIDSYEAVDDSPFNVKDIIETSNIKPIVDGKEVEYEDSKEGLAQYVTDVHDTGVEYGAEQFYTNLINKFPIVEDVLNHLELNNGQLDNFTQDIDYTTITIDKDDSDKMKSIIYAARKMRGENDKQIESYYEYIKSADLEKSTAETELEYLKTNQIESRANKQKELESIRAAEIQQENDYWGVNLNDKHELNPLNVENSIYDLVVNKGELKVGKDSIKIPDKIRVTEDNKVKYYSKLDFFKYLYVTEPVRDKDGNVSYKTKDSIKLEAEMSKRTNANSVLEAYKRFTNYDDSQQIINKVQKARIKDMKNKTVRKYSIKSTVDKGGTNDEKLVY